MYTVQLMEGLMALGVFKIFYLPAQRLLLEKTSQLYLAQQITMYWINVFALDAWQNKYNKLN